jgi:hypothetical protein
MTRTVVFSISGMDWVANRAPNTYRPSIASMSLGSPASDAVDSAVTTVRRPLQLTLSV